MLSVEGFATIATCSVVGLGTVMATPGQDTERSHSMLGVSRSVRREVGSCSSGSLSHQVMVKYALGGGKSQS